MSLEPFLRREWATSVRSSRAFRDRGTALLLTGLVALGCFALWDQLGWDRSSMAGGLRFGLASFSLMIAMLAVLGLPIVIPGVVSALAPERERQGLDTLLASEFTSLEIVLGAIACGLFRHANAVAAALPVLVLVMALGGVAPSWLALALLALAATALLMAALSVVVSVQSRTGPKAVNTASGLFLLWVGTPATFMILKPLILPGAPAWVDSIALALVDASPSGLILDLSGVNPRPGGPVGAIFRLVACEGLASLLLIWWAVARFRPIARGDGLFRGGSRLSRLISRLLQPPAPRPNCGDDPVLWQEITSSGGVSTRLRVLGQAISLMMLLGLGLGLWWFAVPAFQELASRGYRPSAEAFGMPPVDPIARLLVNNGCKTAIHAASGQARLEFNIVLRQVSALFLVGFIAVAFSTSLETLKGEQTRDTWLGLISTPLSGWEILRAKMGGTVWKIRDGAFTLLGLWTIGLISGAIHPLGFLLAYALLLATGAFFMAQGQALAIFSLNSDRTGKTVIPTPLVLILMAATLAQVAAPMILVWASLFTYEDVVAILEGGLFPQFTQTDLANSMRARSVLLTCLSGTAILGLGAALLNHTNARSFDEAIGRPTQPAFRRRSLTVSALQAQAVCDAVLEV